MYHLKGENIFQDNMTLTIIFQFKACHIMDQDLSHTKKGHSMKRTNFFSSLFSQSNKVSSSPALWIIGLYLWKASWSNLCTYTSDCYLGDFTIALSAVYAMHTDCLCGLMSVLTNNNLLIIAIQSNYMRIRKIIRQGKNLVEPHPFTNFSNLFCPINLACWLTYYEAEGEVR